MLTRLRKLRACFLLGHLWKKPNVQRALSDYLEIVGLLLPRDQALHNVFDWIKRSFESQKDGGSSAYYSMTSGWKASYPETTGYLIPTLYKYWEETSDATWKTLAQKATDWLLSIQRPSGGWQAFQVDTQSYERVFNTGMIIDGLCAAYDIEGSKRILNSAIKGAEWIVSQQDMDNYWRKSNIGQGGAYDALVCACLLEVWKRTNMNAFKDAATRGLDVISRLQTKNGWFDRCNGSETSHEPTALTHHLGYTLEGFLRAGQILNYNNYFECARRTSERLLSRVEVNRRLAAEYGPHWEEIPMSKGRINICVTGCSQVARVFDMIAQKTRDLRYLNASAKLIDFVSAVGALDSQDQSMKNGTPGSYPIYGNYQSFQFVNWAAKYHADAIMFHRQISKQLFKGHALEPHKSLNIEAQSY